jgi:polysaccharide pyruvyl transferase WcaK-like protein
MSYPAPTFQPLPVSPRGVRPEGSPREAKGRPRIGLLSPYTGSNLGDAAIIESARTHLLRLFPDAGMLLIVLNCGRASRAHGLDSFPLTAVPRAFYFTVADALPAEAPVGDGSPTARPPALPGGMRSALKGAARHVPLVLPAAQRLRDHLHGAALEALHLMESWRMVKSLDCLVVVGGGQFDDEFGGPWAHPYSMLKWTRLAAKEGVPVSFIGTGVDKLRYPLSRLFLRNTLSRAQRVSLRDAESLDMLRRMGIQGDLIYCPDLAFGLAQPRGDTPFPHSLPPQRLTIGLSPIAYGLPGSWPTDLLALFNRYWREWESFAVSLLDSGHAVSLFCTDDADLRLTRRLYDRLKVMPNVNGRVQLLPGLSLPRLMSGLKTFDAVVASRLHGCLLSHLCGTPALAISYRRKVAAHMADMGQERFSLDFENFTATEARRSLFDLLGDREALSASLARACEVKRKAVEEEFVAVGKKLTLRSGNK